MIPEPIRLARLASLVVFETPYDASWVIIRSASGKPDTFDGLSTLNYKQPGGSWRSLQIPVATFPGSHYLQNPMNPNGTARICPGQYRGSHRLGTHGDKPALVQIPGRLVVLRDDDRDKLWDPADAKEWTDASGCNHHACSNPAYLAGCPGSPWAQLEEFLAEFRWLQTKRKQDTISLSLVVA